MRKCIQICVFVLLFIGNAIAMGDPIEEVTMAQKERQRYSGEPWQMKYYYHPKLDSLLLTTADIKEIRKENRMAKGCKISRQHTAKTAMPDDSITFQWSKRYLRITQHAVRSDNRISSMAALVGDTLYVGYDGENLRSDNKHIYSFRVKLKDKDYVVLKHGVKQVYPLVRQEDRVTYPTSRRVARTTCEKLNLNIYNHWKRRLGHYDLYLNEDGTFQYFEGDKMVDCGITELTCDAMIHPCNAQDHSTRNILILKGQKTTKVYVHQVEWNDHPADRLVLYNAYIENDCLKIEKTKSTWNNVSNKKPNGWLLYYFYGE